jgi:hypothetical protein
MTLNSIKACNDRLAALGQKRQVFSNLKNAQAAVAAAEKRHLSRDPNQPNNREPRPVSPQATAASKKEITLKAIADSNDPSELSDLYAKLSAHILNELKTESDAFKRTELTREYQRSEKNRGYSLLAEKQLSPAKAATRKFIAKLDR